MATDKIQKHNGNFLKTSNTSGTIDKYPSKYYVTKMIDTVVDGQHTIDMEVSLTPHAVKLMHTIQTNPMKLLEIIPIETINEIMEVQKGGDQDLLEKYDAFTPRLVAIYREFIVHNK